jgi:hypothetical protein
MVGSDSRRSTARHSRHSLPQDLIPRTTQASTRRLAGRFDDATELAAPLERLSDFLGQIQADSAEASTLAQESQKEAAAARELLKPILHG